MFDTQKAYQEVIDLLNNCSVEYKLFEHQPAFSYEELKKVQEETGFFGSEGKCMVLKANDKFFVYVTLCGNKVNFDVIKEKLGVKKVRLALPEELKENFGAEPGCAYPFGFDAKFDIYIDPVIYETEWFLFSPVLPSVTVQAKGGDLKKVFSSLKNKVTEVTDFNQ